MQRLGCVPSADARTLQAGGRQLPQLLLPLLRCRSAACPRRSAACRRGPRLLRCSGQQPPHLVCFVFPLRECCYQLASVQGIEIIWVHADVPALLRLWLLLRPLNLHLLRLRLLLRLLLRRWRPASGGSGGFGLLAFWMHLFLRGCQLLQSRARKQRFGCAQVPPPADAATIPAL
jgi:hypothetical protein